MAGPPGQHAALLHTSERILAVRRLPEGNQPPGPFQDHVRLDRDGNEFSLVAFIRWLCRRLNRWMILDVSWMRLLSPCRQLIVGVRREGDPVLRVWPS